MFPFPILLLNDIFLSSALNERSAILWEKVEDMWNADPLTADQEFHVLIKFNHTNFWSHRFGRQTIHTSLEPALSPFSKRARAYFLRIVRALDQLFGDLWEGAISNCVQQCQNPGTCKGNSLYSIIRSVMTVFRSSVRAMPTMEFGKRILSEWQSLFAKVIPPFLHLKPQEQSADNVRFAAPPDCSDDEVRFLEMCRMMVALQMYANMQMHRLYSEIATRVFASDKGQLTVNANINMVFDMAGAECLAVHLCNSRVELGKAVLARILPLPGADEMRYVAELGVLDGGWSLSIARDVSNVVMLAVDPYDCAYECYGPTAHMLLLHDRVHAAAEAFRDRYQLITQSSDNASKWIGNRTLDLLFIDAGHSYRFCSSDVRNWAPKVKPGGVIMFHDYWLEYDSVMRCILEAFEQLAVGPLYVSLNFMAYFYTSKQTA